MLSPALYQPMGFVDKLLGGGKHTIEDYITLDSDDIEKTAEGTLTVHIADISSMEDVIEVKDKIYDGDLVISI